MPQPRNSSADVQSSGPETAEEVAAEKMVNDKAGRLLRILGFNFDLKTTAAAGNRFMGYEITDGANHTQFEALTPALPEKAPDGSNLYGICGGIDFPHDTVVASRTILLPLPDIALPFNWKWTALSQVKVVGDTFPLFRLCYEWVYL